MSTENEILIAAAKSGDINAFQQLFSEFQAQLKAYLYRMVTDRNDADDLTHDTFVKAFDKIASFQSKSSLKTWVFTIATHLAYDHQKKYKRWMPNAQDLSKALAISNQEANIAITQAHLGNGYRTYDIKEHIDFCFTCISKTLPIEHQVALLLKDVYDFTVQDIGAIIDKTEGVVKHLLIDARKTMIAVFENRCALINKTGACNQCSELNGLYNPQQQQQQALMKLEMVKNSTKFNRESLYEMRLKLVKAIDPLRSSGSDLQDIIMKCTRKAIGEIEVIN